MFGRTRLTLRDRVNGDSLLGVVAYRSTERTETRRLEARERVIAAATDLIAAGGYRAASVAAVAAQANLATGSVYRHFPSKTDLFAEVFRRAAQREVDVAGDAMGASAPAAERLTGGVQTFARRALRGGRLAWALIAEPVDPAVEDERLQFRRAYRDLFADVLRDGIAAGELPEQDVELAAAAMVGAIGEALVGPLAPSPGRRTPDRFVDGLVAFCLRSVTDEEHGRVGDPAAA